MKILKYLIICFTTISFSQNIIVEYDGLISVFDKKKAEKNEIINDVIKLNPKFILKIEDSISSFILLEKLDANEKEKAIQKISNSLLKYKYTYYNKNTKNIYYKIESNLFINEIINHDWIITNVTKKIDNYECIKAILNEEITNINGKKIIRKITAWFAPFLPYSFGPLGYNSLPGLILELEYSNIKYVAKKIEFTEKSIFTEKPMGKIISRNEYRKSLGLNFE